MPLSSASIPSFTLPPVDPPGEPPKLLPPYDQPPFKRGILTLMSEVSASMDFHKAWLLTYAPLSDATKLAEREARLSQTSSQPHARLERHMETAHLLTTVGR